MLKKIVLILVIGGAALFIVAQLVPFGRAHDNPPVVQEPNWDSAETRALAQTACFDCHSNESVWPWYSNIAPVSWMVQHHVDEGREYLNFSDWGQCLRGEEAEELAEVIREGEMPVSSYLVLHSEARLSDADKEALAQGLLATARASSSTACPEGRRDHD
ncbi:MAG: heme-binding domain-containing protein [Anaerolineae bacterium]|nr:heme-binding domain-containing protein [Anaerolineae bacterium]